MSELIQQLGNLLGKEIFTPDYPVKISQIVVLFAILAVSCVIANFLRRRFREFFKGRLLALLFSVVRLLGCFWGYGLQELGREFLVNSFIIRLQTYFFSHPKQKLKGVRQIL